MTSVNERAAQRTLHTIFKAKLVAISTGRNAVASFHDRGAQVWEGGAVAANDSRCPGRQDLSRPFPVNCFSVEFIGTVRWLPRATENKVVEADQTPVLEHMVLQTNMKAVDL